MQAKECTECSRKLAASNHRGVCTGCYRRLRCTVCSRYTPGQMTGKRCQDHVHHGRCSRPESVRQDPPGHEERIRLYTERVSQKLPIFSGPRKKERA